MHAFFRTIVPLFLLLAVSCEKEPERKAYPEEGDNLPPFSITLSDGSKSGSSELSTGRSLIVFFSTSCIDCRGELPEIQKFQEGYGDRVGVVAIAREEGLESVSSYWNSNGFTIPFSPQEDRAVYSLFAERGIPLCILSEDGVIIRKHDSYVRVTCEMLREDFGL